jgi:tetratricopeptide (TPR) repeat protein
MRLDRSGAKSCRTGSRYTGLRYAVLCISCVCTVWLPVTAEAQANSRFEDLLREGFALHQQAHYADALPLLERALKLEPNDYYANLLVGIDLLRTGRPKEGLTCLGMASRVKPAEDIPLDYIVEADASLHLYADAAEASSRAVAVAPKSEEAVGAAARFALERFRTVSRELRSTVRGLAADQRLEALSRPMADPERLRLLQSSASLDAQAPGIWNDLARTDAAQGHTDEASSALARAQDVPRSAGSQGGGSAVSNQQQWLRKGELLVDQGQWTEASVALERALQGGEDRTYTGYLLCWTYAQWSSDLVRLLEAQQESDVVHRILGDVLLRIHGDGKAAAEEYTIALRTNSGDPGLLEELAEAQFMGGQTDAAVQSAQAALRRDPNRFSAMQTLAAAALQQRRYTDAIQYLKPLQERDPSNQAVKVELGTALGRTGDEAGTVRLLGSALQQGYPDQKGSLHALLGTALRKTGHEQQATEAFATARKLSEQYQQGSHASAVADE